MPRPQTLFGPFVPRPGVTLLFGNPGSGKSFLGLALAATAATGTPWGSMPVESTNVLYWAAEGLWTVSERLKAWESHHKVSIPPEKLQIVFEPMKIDSENDLSSLRAHVAGSDVGLIIVDTVSQSSGQLSESSNDDMAEYISRLESISSVTGAASLIIHHSGWTETARERGASALRGNVDQTLQVARKVDRRKITMHKNRSGPDNFSQDIVTFSQAGSLVLVPTDDPSLKAQDQVVLAAIEGATCGGGWVQTKEIVHASGIDRRLVPGIARRLSEMDLIEIEPPTGRGSPAEYRIKRRDSSLDSRAPESGISEGGVQFNFGHL